MKSRLRLLNVVLVVLLAALGYRANQLWKEARAREKQFLNVRVALEKALPLAPLPPYAPAPSANYLEVATKMLLARDRNSTVIYEPPPPAPAPPPMPALPKYYGLMGFGSPGIILSEKAGAAQKTYRPGDKVGDFTLISFDRQRVTFDWAGKTVESALDELVDRSGASTNVQNVSNQVAQAAAPLASVAPSPKGPGAAVPGGSKACQPNDSSPSGTVQDGFRKVEVANPFGKSCSWQPVP